MKKLAYFKVVLATSLVWVFLDIFLLLYFSECNKCEDKERGLPARDACEVSRHWKQRRRRFYATSVGRWKYCTP